MACGEDGRVFYDGEDRALWWAQPEGAPTRLTTRLDTELAHGLPHLLPGGKVLLFTVSPPRLDFRRRGGVCAGDRHGRAPAAPGQWERRPLRCPGTPRVLAPGHPLRRAVRSRPPGGRGTPAPVLNGVAQALTSGCPVRRHEGRTARHVRHGNPRVPPRGRGLLPRQRDRRGRPAGTRVARSTCPSAATFPRSASPPTGDAWRSRSRPSASRRSGSTIGTAASGPAPRRRGEPTRPGGRRTASTSPSPG